MFNFIYAEEERKTLQEFRRVKEYFYYIDADEDVSQELKEFRELFNFIDAEEERKILQEFRRVKEYFYYIDADEERVTGVLFVV